MAGLVCCVSGLRRHGASTDWQRICTKIILIAVVVINSGFTDACFKPSVSSVMTRSIEIDDPPHQVNETTTVTYNHRRACLSTDDFECFNGGICFAFELAGGSRSLQCRCLYDYKGKQCEERRFDPSEVVAKGKVQLALVSVSVAAGLFIVIVICIFFAYRRLSTDRARSNVTPSGGTTSNIRTDKLQPLQQYNVELINEAKHH